MALKTRSAQGGRSSIKPVAKVATKAKVSSQKPIKVMGKPIKKANDPPIATKSPKLDLKREIKPQVRPAFDQGKPEKQYQQVKPSPQAQPIEQAKQALKKAVPTKAKVPAKTPKSRKLALDIDPKEAASALEAKWATLFKKADQIESKPYNMRATFEEKTAIVHKVLGWGYILTNRNDRLEVLFKDGIKYLISNYKP